MKKRRVVVALDLARSDGRRKMDGLMRYLKTRRINWDIRIKHGIDDFQTDAIRTLVRWDIDGVVFSLPTDLPEHVNILNTLLAQPFPVVLIDPEEQIDLSWRAESLSVLRTDPDDVGEIAANCLLGQGTCRSYAFVADILDRPWSRRRARSFANALAARGAACEVYHPRTTEESDFDELCAMIDALPKPAGILVAYDDRALAVIAACEAIGAAVPRDVSILSVNDDTILCDNIVPTLSSIRADQESVGYAAGAALSALLRGEPVARETHFPDKTLSHRDSTTAASTGGRLVQKALAYIRVHAHKNLTGDDVAESLHVSRKLLDLRFRELLATSVAKTISGERLSHVARLLATTQMPIKEISDASGFSSAYHLMHRFRRHYGMTMRQYRLSNRR